MKTPIEELKQELLDEVDLTPELRKFIGRINHLYLEKEKQVIIEAYYDGYEDMASYKSKDGKYYYNKTFNK